MMVPFYFAALQCTQHFFHAASLARAPATLVAGQPQHARDRPQARA